MSTPTPVRRLALSVAALALATPLGCGGPLTQLELTDAGNRIRVLEGSEVVNCDELGSTTVKTVVKVAFIPRKDMRIDNELEMRARNEAPTIEGANAIAPAGPSINGKRKFLIYRCP